MTAMDAPLDQLTGAIVDCWRTLREPAADADTLDDPDLCPEPGE